MEEMVSLNHLFPKNLVQLQWTQCNYQIFRSMVNGELQKIKWNAKIYSTILFIYKFNETQALQNTKQ